MSTAELKEIIDQRTPEERKWMTAYLLDEIFSVPELRETALELSELARRRGDLLAGHSRVSEAGAAKQLLMVHRTQRVARALHGSG